MPKAAIALAALLAVAACVPQEAVPLKTSTPNADSVSVRVDGGVEFMDEGEKAAVFARADAEADARCQAAGRREAVFNTSQNVPTAEGFDIERLYICIT